MDPNSIFRPKGNRKRTETLGLNQACIRPQSPPLQGSTSSNRPYLPTPTKSHLLKRLLPMSLWKANSIQTTTLALKTSCNDVTPFKQFSLGSVKDLTDIKNLDGQPIPSVNICEGEGIQASLSVNWSWPLFQPHLKRNSRTPTGKYNTVDSYHLYTLSCTQVISRLLGIPNTMQILQTWSV